MSGPNLPCPTRSRTVVFRYPTLINAADNFEKGNAQAESKINLQLADHRIGNRNDAHGVVPSFTQTGTHTPEPTSAGSAATMATNKMIDPASQVANLAG